jgi:PLP dependent protein
VVDLGENRTGEYAAKRALVEGARWHFVGQLQRRSANEVVGTDVLIHSVDRRSLVDRVERLADAAGVVQRVLVQVNVGDDPAKGGCGLDEVGDLVAYARDHPHVAVEGLMTVPPLPPAGADPNQHARPHFARLAALRAEVATDAPEVRDLSMGMTADLESAIAEGATHVRVGTALFGTRGSGPWQP